MTVSTPSIGALSPFDAIRQDGDRWSARDMCSLMAYSSWQKFETPLKRAMATARNEGLDVANLFNRSVEKSGGRPREDYLLARYAAYLVAMNGDPNIPEVASAQHYFAVKTREAETGVRQLPQDYASALRELAATVEANAELEARIAIDAPKVGYVDTYVADSDLLTLRTLASNLDVGEQWLRQLLVDRGWIYFQESTRWSERQQRKVTTRRYSAYSDKRSYFEAKAVHDAPRFRGEVMHTLKVTPTGAEAIARLVRRELAREVTR